MAVGMIICVPVPIEDSECYSSAVCLQNCMFLVVYLSVSRCRETVTLCSLYVSLNLFAQILVSWSMYCIPLCVVCVCSVYCWWSNCTEMLYYGWYFLAHLTLPNTTCFDESSRPPNFIPTLYRNLVCSPCVVVYYMYVVYLAQVQSSVFPVQESLFVLLSLQYSKCLTCLPVFCVSVVKSTLFSRCYKSTHCSWHNYTQLLLIVNFHILMLHSLSCKLFIIVVITTT